MRTQRVITIACLAGSLAALPSILAAAEPSECVAGKPTAASYNWNFRTEATGLLQDVQSEAAQVQNRADTLQRFAQSVDLSWQMHADELTQLKDEVNDMGAHLCRLTVIRRVLAPWQQKAIDRIAPQIQLIADNAEDAITFLNNHEQSLWQPAYKQYLHNVYREASSVSNTVENFETYARARSEYQELRNTLGMKTTS